MIKRLKNIAAIATALSWLSVPGLRYLSSSMQSYYKAQMEDFTKDARELLNKKMFWANLSESLTPTLVLIFYAVVAVLLLLLFAEWVQDRRKRLAAAIPPEDENAVDA